jgi:hypothetical protein
MFKKRCQYPVEKWAMQGRVGAHHEMFNGQMKNWGIHSQVFHHRIIYSLHGDVSRGCVSLRLRLRLRLR